MQTGKDPENHFETTLSRSLRSHVAEDITRAQAVLEEVNEFKLRRYSPRDVLYHQDHDADTVYLIKSGLVKLISHLPTGRARIVRLNSENQWIGLEGLLDKRYAHHAEAYDEVEAYAISRSSLQHLRDHTPHIYCNVLEHWYRHLQQADRWIAGFSTGCIKSRVANLIEYLADLEYGAQSERVKLLTVSEMGEILGVTPESVSRILAEFKRNDILHHTPTAPKEVYEFEAGRLQQEARV